MLELPRKGLAMRRRQFIKQSILLILASAGGAEVEKCLDLREGLACAPSDSPEETVAPQPKTEKQQVVAMNADTGDIAEFDIDAPTRLEPNDYVLIDGPNGERTIRILSVTMENQHETSSVY